MLLVHHAVEHDALVRKDAIADDHGVRAVEDRDHHHILGGVDGANDLDLCRSHLGPDTLCHGIDEQVQRGSHIEAREDVAGNLDDRRIGEGLDGVLVAIAHLRSHHDHVVIVAASDGVIEGHGVEVVVQRQLLGQCAEAVLVHRGGDAGGAAQQDARGAPDVRLLEHGRHLEEQLLGTQLVGQLEAHAEHGCPIGLARQAHLHDLRAILLRVEPHTAKHARRGKTDVLVVFPSNGATFDPPREDPFAILLANALHANPRLVAIGHVAMDPAIR